MEKLRINVRAIVWRDGKLLAVKHKEKDGSEAAYWAVPGGGLDPMEGVVECVKREVLEELGVNAEVGKLLMVQQFPSRRLNFDEELELLFHVEDSPAFDAVEFEKTTHGFEELSRVEFVDPKTVPILPTFLAEIDIEALISGDQAVFVANELNDL